MTGAIPPGEHLRQEDVAQRLGISRSPAREALARLAMEGLVEARPRRGYVVSSLDTEEIEEIFGMLVLLEERAGVLAGQRRTAQDIEELKRKFHALDTTAIHSPEDIDTYSAAHREFHERVLQSSGSRHLCRTIMQLRDQLERYVRLEMSMQDHVDSGDHGRIFKAFAAGNGDLLGRLSRQHCEKMCRKLVQRLPRGRQASAGGPGNHHREAA